MGFELRKVLSYQHCENLIHAFITSWLDYCTALPFGLPQHLTQKLQHVQNSAPRLLLVNTNILHLFERNSIGSKFKNGMTKILSYVDIRSTLLVWFHRNILETYKPARSLGSNIKRLLIVAKYHLKTYGLRAFSVIAPRLWNDLRMKLKQLIQWPLLKLS